MRLYAFEIEGRRRLGLEAQGQLVDLSATYASYASRPGANANPLRALPSELSAFLPLGEPAWACVRAVATYIGRRPAAPVGERFTYAFEEVRLGSLLPRPGKILCLEGLPFQDSAPPAGSATAELRLFTKWPSAVIGPGDAILAPGPVAGLSARPSLAVVIGARVRRKAVAEVMTHIAGYTLLLDVRGEGRGGDAWQRALGGNCDTFCPIGPCLVTPDDRPGGGGIKVACEINAVRCWEDPCHFEWNAITDCLARLSHHATLDPGDVVAFGVQQRPCPLQVGDKVTMRSEPCGVLESVVMGMGEGSVRALVQNHGQGRDCRT